MKKIILLACIVFFYSLTSYSICNDPLKPQEVCFEMRHLRSQVLALGAQRDLMQTNYGYYEAIGNELTATVNSTINYLTRNPDMHMQGLVEIKKLSTEFEASAQTKSPETFKIANKIQMQCASCHAKDKPQSGYKWDDIFKQDWSTIYTKCNSGDHNPYYCKSMHGMLSSYSYFATANNLNRFNFKMTKYSANEIQRIATQLKSLGMYHGGEQFIQKLVDKATEVVTLADQQNPAAYQKGVELGNSCMSCHGEN